MKKPKLMLGIVTREHGVSKSAFNILSLKKPEGTNLKVSEIPDISRARNYLIEQFLKSDKTHFLFLDSDHFITPSQTNLIERLLSRDVDVVSGLYYRRGPPHYPIILYESRKPIVAYGKRMGYKFEYKYNKEDYPENKMIEVHAVPAGCLMIKRKVLEAMGDGPWFQRTAACGEDIYFSIKARNKGFKLYVDTSIKLLHFYTDVVGPIDCVREYYQLIFGLDVLDHGYKTGGNKPQEKPKVRRRGP